MRKAPKRECNPAYLLVAVGLIVALSGCSGEYPTYPITGTVRFPDGSPLTVGQIYFETRDERYGMGISAMGRIDENGNFSVGVYQRDEGGAPPGNYVVYFRGAKQGAVVADSAVERSSGYWIIHEKHRSGATSDIRVDVTEAGPNIFEITVEPP
jgi:hypothetical protein